MLIKKKTLIILILLILLVLAIIYFVFHNSYKDPYEFNGNTLHYSESRGKANYEISLKYHNGTFDVYYLNFTSRNFLDNPTLMHALLFMPNNKANKKVPGLVLLPGGGVSKEGESRLASIIANLGYAVLTIDQRGIGQTGGYYLSLEDDYQVFLKGKEPVQHLSVYDALKTYDILRNINGMDKNNIGIMGESMGGRYAIIAAAIDKQLKGVIAISVSGFHLQNSPQANAFLVSIDPDHYIDKISPNHVFMFQSENDKTTKIQDAQLTFNLAKEPKRFYSFSSPYCMHGYCAAMYDDLKEALEILFK